MRKYMNIIELINLLKMFRLVIEWLIIRAIQLVYTMLKSSTILQMEIMLKISIARIFKKNWLTAVWCIPLHFFSFRSKCESQATKQSEWVKEEVCLIWYGNYLLSCATIRDTEGEITFLWTLDSTLREVTVFYWAEQRFVRGYNTLSSVPQTSYFVRKSSRKFNANFSKLFCFIFVPLYYIIRINIVQ